MAAQLLEDARVLGCCATRAAMQAALACCRPRAAPAIPASGDEHPMTTPSGSDLSRGLVQLGEQGAGGGRLSVREAR